MLSQLSLMLKYNVATRSLAMIDDKPMLFRIFRFCNIHVLFKENLIDFSKGLRRPYGWWWLFYLTPSRLFIVTRNGPPCYHLNNVIFTICKIRVI